MKSFVWSMKTTIHNGQCLSLTENVDINIRRMETIRFYTLYTINNFHRENASRYPDENLLLFNYRAPQEISNEVIDK